MSFEFLNHKVQFSATKKYLILKGYIYITFLYAFLIVWWFKEEKKFLHTRTIKKEG
jgi:hypothetical protein